MRRVFFPAILLLAYGLIAPGMAPAQSALKALEQKVQQDVQGGTTPPAAAAPSTPVTPTAEAGHERGYAGLVADDQADRGRGVRILKIAPGGPAERAGLQPQDLITALDGVRVRQLSDMAMILEQTVPGQAMQFEVLRGDEPQRLTLTFGRPMPRATTAKPPLETPQPPAPGIVAPAATPDASQARIEQLERRVEQMEQRIQALERALGFSSTNPPAK